MISLKKKDFRSPSTSLTIERLMAALMAVTSHQAAAADLTSTFVADHAGQVRGIACILHKAFAAVEKMTIDIQVNGTSILPSAAPQEFNASSGVATPIEIVCNATSIAVGDTISIVRDWTTSGGVNAEPENVVIVQWS